MPEPFDYSVVDEALDKCGCKTSAIIAILQTIQEHYHYLPEEVFPYLSERLGMSEARILERVRTELGVSEKKKTTDDQLFTIETVSCLGACGLAPVMTVNDVVHPAMTPDKAMEIIYSLKVKEESR